MEVDVKEVIPWMGASSSRLLADITMWTPGSWDSMKPARVMLAASQVERYDTGFLFVLFTFLTLLPVLLVL